MLFAQTYLYEKWNLIPNMINKQILLTWNGHAYISTTNKHFSASLAISVMGIESSSDQVSHSHSYWQQASYCRFCWSGVGVPWLRHTWKQGLLHHLGPDQWGRGQQYSEGVAGSILLLLSDAFLVGNLSYWLEGYSWRCALDSPAKPNPLGFIYWQNWMPWCLFFLQQWFNGILVTDITGTLKPTFIQTLVIGLQFSVPCLDEERLLR